MSTPSSRGPCSRTRSTSSTSRALHGLQIDVDPEAIAITDHNVEYDAHIVDPNFGPMDQHIKVFGTNTIMLTGEMAGMQVFMGSSAVPVPSGGSRNFQFAATPRGDGAAGEEEQADAALTMALAFGEQLLKDDDPVMTTVHFREDLLLPADRALTRFLRYVRSFPSREPRTRLPGLSPRAKQAVTTRLGSARYAGRSRRP